MNAMSKNDLSTIRQPSRQPYEVIETLEETITRYYDPTSFGKSILRANRSQHIESDYKRAEEQTRSEDNSNLEITFKNIAVQDLYEKFKNLRKVMSEIIERILEMNMSAQKNNNLSASTNVADIQNGCFDDRNKPEISELEEDDEEQQTQQAPITCLFLKKSITTFSEDFNFDSDVNLQLKQSRTQLSSPKFLNVQAVHDNDDSLFPFKDQYSL